MKREKRQRIRELVKELRDFGLDALMEIRRQERVSLQQACWRKTQEIRLLKMNLKEREAENKRLTPANGVLSERISIYDRYLKIEHPEFELPGDAEIAQELGLKEAEPHD